MEGRERREELLNAIASLMEGGVGDDEWNVERVEHHSTCSGEVSVASIKSIIRTRSGVFLLEEEVEMLEDTGINEKRRHRGWVVRINE